MKCPGVNPKVTHNSSLEARNALCLRKDVSLNTPKQREFTRLLGDLWDAYFDVRFEHVDYVAVGDAISAMIEFLVDVSVTDPHLESIAVRPGDLLLVRKVNGLLCSHFRKMPSELGAILDMCHVPRVKKLHSPHIILIEHGLIFCVSELFLSRNLTKPQRSWLTFEKCRCGDGPYLRLLNVACMMDTCSGHMFCEDCLIEPVRSECYGERSACMKSATERSSNEDFEDHREMSAFDNESDNRVSKDLRVMGGDVVKEAASDFIKSFFK